MYVLNSLRNLYVFCLKVLVGVGTKDKPLVRTENSSSVDVWSERLCIMFLLCWEVYVLMELVLNLQNEDLDWFSVKRTFIDGGVYMQFNGGLGLVVTSSVMVLFRIFRCVSVW